MSDNILPEEKLLRLIRGNKNNNLAGDKVDKEPAVSLKPTPKYYGRHLFQKMAFLFNFQIMLWVFFIVACFYLIILFIYPWLGLQGFKSSPIISEKISEPNNAPLRDAKPYEFYSQGIGSRRIFTSPSKQETYKEPVKSLAQDSIRDITLLGIVSGDNPQAIIEDKLTQKTYYLNKGQFIRELQVRDIQEGKIILDFNGQAIELNL